VPRAIEAKMMMNSMLCTTATGPRALPARIATQKPTSRASRIRCLRCAKAVLRPGVHWPVRVAPRCASVGMATSPIGDIPPFLLSNEPGTWAYDTMSRRVRENILEPTIADNEFNEESSAKLEALRQELLNATSTKLRDIEDDGGPDVPTWKEIMTPYTGNNTWLDAPW